MGVARRLVSLRLPLTLLARLDRLRGDVGRNTYLTRVIENHVNDEELRRHVNEAAPLRPREESR